MVTEEEFDKIKDSGCNLSKEMELKAIKNLVEVNKIREDSLKKLRDFLFWLKYDVKRKINNWNKNISWRVGK